MCGIYIVNVYKIMSSMRRLLLDQLMSGEGVGLNKCIALTTPIQKCF